MNYSYDSKKTAQRIANKRNKDAGKKIWVVVEEDDVWIILSINSIITDYDDKKL